MINTDNTLNLSNSPSQTIYLHKANGNNYADTFIPLEVFSTMVKPSNLNSYENELKEWESDMDSYERLGIGKKPVKPKLPIEKPEFKKTYFNLNSKKILNFTEDHTLEYGSEVIIMEFLEEGATEIYQIIFKMSLEKWIHILISLGFNIKEI